MKVTTNKVTSKISIMSVIQSPPFNLQSSKIITIKQLGVKPSDYSFSFPLTPNRQVTSGLRWSKNVPGGTCVLPSIAVVQIVNNQLSLFNEILCTRHKLSAFESPFDGRTRISSNCTIKSRFPSFIPCLFYRWQHYLWCRYWFSRPSRWPQHAFWPRLSFDSFSPLGPAGPVIPVFPDFPGGPMGPWEPFFPFWPLLPRGPFDPVKPGSPGGPAGQTFSLDLQYLSGISCSNCLMISLLTSSIVMLTEVSFKTCLRFLGGMIVNCILDNGTTVVKKISFRNYNN